MTGAGCQDSTLAQMLGIVSSTAREGSSDCLHFKICLP